MCNEEGNTRSGKCHTSVHKLFDIGFLLTFWAPLEFNAGTLSPVKSDSIDLLKQNKNTKKMRKSPTLILQEHHKH